ncbi:MAG: hypothetical protein ACHP79_00005 [Terriglobales bacterium]
MKRILIILTMLATCLPLPSVAQDEPEPQPDAKPCFKVDKVQTNADAVAQGGRISVLLRLEAKGCDVVYQQRETGSKVAGLSFDERSPFRVTGGSTSYSQTHSAIELDAATHAPLITRRLEYSLLLEALLDAPVGDQNLVATLSYQTMDAAGTLSSRQQTLSVPIKVAPAGTRMQPRHQPTAKERRETIILIALAPVLLPLMLISSIAYYIQHGQWPSS